MLIFSKPILFCWQTDDECRTFSLHTLSHDGSPMALNNFAAYGKPHSGSIKFAVAMQSLERFENKFGKLRIKPSAVVFYKKLTHSPPV